MPLSSRYRLHNSLGYQLSLTARVQERRLEEGLKPLGLTRTTWCVLLAVENERLSRPSEIAAFVGIDRTAISRALRQMEADGIIARRGGTSDRRTKEVQATDLGRSRLAAGTPYAEANVQVIEDRLNEAEREALRCLLAKARGDDELVLDRI